MGVVFWEPDSEDQAEAQSMDLIKNTSQSPLRPFKEKCYQNFEKLSPVRLRRNSVDGGRVGTRVLENFNKGFNRYSALNLSGRKVRSNKSEDRDNDKSTDYLSHLTVTKDMLKLQSMKHVLTKDIHLIKEALTSISSINNLKRKQSNIINEEREEFAVVDLTIDLCDNIINDAVTNEKDEAPSVKRIKYSNVDVTN